MVEEYFQSSVQLKETHNYLIITLKIAKAIFPVCEVKNSNRAFRREVVN